MSDPVAVARRAYAEELRFTVRLRSAAVVEALATVPRERFVGPGPWRIKSPWDLAEYWTTEEADPCAVYHDVLIALDEVRGINNGQPALWAFLLDRLGIERGEEVLHLGCGTGYYTALIAELVGPTGRVSALELDPTLATKARANLAAWPRVSVENGDGASLSFEPQNLVVASAGATHPLPSWLDAVKPGGRLLFPLTGMNRSGGMLFLRRDALAPEAYAARFLCPAGFIDFRGARDAGVGQRLDAALTADRGASVRSLRRDRHAEDSSCWLHGEGWCLSHRVPSGAAPAKDSQ
ncbi:MAG TPA: methyltransferase domain-containing protein [Stellaceae bacterium]|nr:methyltransferase domain-containing protein [Stellaceae bacterium]